VVHTQALDVIWIHVRNVHVEKNNGINSSQEIIHLFSFS